MQAGKLRHRITIQNATETNTSGSLSQSWGTYATVWSAVEPLSGREYFQSQQVTAEVTTRFRIRYRSGVTPLMRISWDSRTFEIQSVIRDATNNREMVLMCREIQT